MFLKDAGFIGVRHIFSTTLHRKWRGWLNSRFNEALLDGNHTHFHLQHGGVDASGGRAAPPDNVDQRVQELIKGMTGGAIGLAMGVIGVVTSLLFVGQKLIETSTVVNGLEFLGAYGSAVLAFSAVALYVPFNTYFALKIGGLLERLTVSDPAGRRQLSRRADDLFRRSFHVAASRGENVQKEMHDRLYLDIDRTWARLNRVNAGYMSFELIYDFVAARIVAYGPSLMPYMHDKISLKNYMTGAELVNSLISQCSWFIHVMPDDRDAQGQCQAGDRSCRGDRKRAAAARVLQPDRPLGISLRQPGRSVRPDVRNLELVHQGNDAAPFLTRADLRFRRGEWTFVKGKSGSGKTSLIKAINGLWPYGRGNVVFPEGVKTFYAAQDVKLPRISLKELVCLPTPRRTIPMPGSRRRCTGPDSASSSSISATKAARERSGTSCLSGGQKQKLSSPASCCSSRACCSSTRRPARSIREAKIAFHQAIKDNCPRRHRDQHHA